MEHFDFLWFFGSLAIFFYGIRLSRSGLQLWFGDRLKPILTSFTRHRLKGLAAGAFITMVFQSSAATAITLISFAGAGLISLNQAMGVLLGADIGTTFVVMLLSVQGISEYGLLVLIVGVVIELYSKRKKSHYFAMILMGFGFVFFGLKLLTVTTHSLGESQTFFTLFSFFKSNPFIMLVATALLTPFTSSAGALGLAIGLSFSGILTLQEALPIVLGANVGTTLTPLLASFSEKQEGKRVALAHLCFKIFGAFVVFIFLKQAVLGVERFCGLLGDGLMMSSHQIAMSHLLFNMCLALFFLPFIGLGAKVIKWIFPDKLGEKDIEFGPKYLKRDHLGTPLLAFSDVRREILRLADLIHEIFRDCIIAFERFDPDLVSELESKEQKTNIIDREIRFFLTKISEDQLTQEQAKTSLRLIDQASLLEDIGDTVVQNLLVLSGKKIQAGIRFSKEGWSELREYHSKIETLLETSISILATPDTELAIKIVHKAKHLRSDETEYRKNHLQRLASGLEESVASSSFHLDALTAFKRIVRNIEKIIQPLS